MEKAPELLAREPTLERIDLLASKVDVAALEPELRAARTSVSD